MCQDCFQNCPQGFVTDKCTQYTGDDFPLLSICNGESLYKFLINLETYLTNLSAGTGITVPSIGASCSYFNNLIGSSPLTLSNLLTSLVNGECDLNARIIALNNQVNTPFSFDPKCLSELLPNNPSPNDYIQVLITQVCSLLSQVSTLPNTYVTKAGLCDAVSACISSNPTAPTQQNMKMVPYTAYEYYGPLSNFDAGGSGLSAFGFDKVYICVGQTVGTFTLPDKRGRVAVGANINVPGGSMDSAVDPSQPNNYQVKVSGKLGEFKHLDIPIEMPSHTHQVNDPGHGHTLQFVNHRKITGGSTTEVPSLGIDPAPVLQILQGAVANTTGITIGNSGSNQPHNNTQPSIGANFIMFVP